MEIKTLKDIKTALTNIPDEILERFGASAGENNNDDVISLMCWPDIEDVDDIDDGENYYKKALIKYPMLGDINKWINNIAYEQEKLLNGDDSVDNRTEPISSEDDSNGNYGDDVTDETDDI